MLVHVLPLALAILRNFVDPNLIVPTGYSQEVGPIRSWREREVGDGVGRRVVEGHVILELAQGVCRRGARRRAEETSHCVCVWR